MFYSAKRLVLSDMFLSRPTGSVLVEMKDAEFLVSIYPGSELIREETLPPYVT